MNWLLKLLGCRCEEKNILINNLNLKIDELNKSSTDLIQPKVLGSININEVRDLLKNHSSNIQLSDVYYSLTSVDEAKKYSVETKVFAERWVVEKHDCDEFSFALMGYWNKGLEQFCFGIAWSAGHAFNIMIDSNKQIWIVEPQTNVFTKIEDVKTNNLYYPLRLILI